MIWLTPRNVMLDEIRLHHVDAIVINRRAEEVVVEHGDAGPHVSFADVTKQVVTVKIRWSPDASLEDAPLPGDEWILRFDAGPSASDARARRVEARIVITDVVTDHRRSQGAMEVIDAVAISEDVMRTRSWRRSARAVDHEQHIRRSSVV